MATSLRASTQEAWGDRIYGEGAGVVAIIEEFAQLLPSPEESSHATLLMLHRTFVAQMVSEGRLPFQNILEELQGAELCLPEPEMTSKIKTLDDPRRAWITDAAAYVRDGDLWFSEFLKVRASNKVSGTGAQAGTRVAMKDKHTIVEKWPTKRKLKKGQPGADQEMTALRASGLRGDERYVEWKRIR